MRKHNYLVGYSGEGQAAYGKENKNGSPQWVILMTEKQAKKYISLSIYDKKMKVFKLVEIK
ncbi:MAG: hypothetical protein WCT51_04875 [Candidatus Shapirobacteria bacterium]|jgi:hypothetical protein